MEARKRKLRVLVLGALLVGLGSSCATIQPFQKKFLNDSEMDLSTRKVQTFELNFQIYREATSGANGGKSGGGCGCN
jgi:hypothetical protein